jgi:ABC-type phosphate transport system substrate-binding protein
LHIISRIYHISSRFSILLPFASEKKNDWSCAELPLTADEHLDVQDADGAVVGAVHLPFVLGAISFFHSVPGIDIKLSADNLAKIYQQEVCTFP